MDGDTRDLIERCRRGDALAFEQLVRRCEGRLFDLAYRLTGSADDACDVRQLALLRLHRSLATFAAAAELDTWLYRVVVNLCRDLCRSALAKKRAAGAGEPAPCEPTEPPPSAALEQGERAAAVRRAVLALPEAEREVVVLRHYQDLPFPAIAALLDLPVTTVKSRMTRGLERLRAALADEALPEPREGSSHGMQLRP